MNTSEQINEIAAALAKAQGAIENPEKNATNPHFNNTFADLASGINAIKTPFASNGLSFIQSTFLDGELLMLTTRLVHSSGQWMEGVYPVCKFPIAQQQAGSAMTYAKRYSLFAMAGIAGEDDDGTEASKTVTPASEKRGAAAPKKPSDPHNSNPFDDEQATPNYEELLARFDADLTHQLTYSGVEGVIDRAARKWGDVSPAQIQDRAVTIARKHHERIASKKKAA